MNLTEIRAHASAVGLSNFHPSTSPILSQGSKGPYVALLHRFLQVALKDRWEGTEEYDALVGESFTNNTRKSLASWQSGEYLLNDGVAGYKTWMALSGIELFRFVYEAPTAAYLTQSQKTRCWAAATATLKGLTMEIQPSPTRTYYLDPIGGLLNDDPAEAWRDNSRNFANDMHLEVITSGKSLLGLLYLMFRHGRLMLNARNLEDNNSHYIVLLTARGDGTEKGTTIGIWDPYPGNNKKGEIMYRSYHWFNSRSRDLTYRVFFTANGDGKKG